ncbi:MAG TPA: tetratricopeptide repeat protein, partial [Ktedonobacteraceae bacterium]
IYLEQNLYSEAKKYYEQAISTIQSVRGEQNVSMARNLYGLAQCHQALTRHTSFSETSAHFAEAGELHIKAYKILKAMGEEEHPLATLILKNLNELRKDWTSHIEKKNGKLG